MFRQRYERSLAGAPSSVGFRSGPIVSKCRPVVDGQAYPWRASESLRGKKYEVIAADQARGDRVLHETRPAFGGEIAFAPA
jgi:hypothetical protein